MHFRSFTRHVAAKKAWPRRLMWILNSLFLTFLALRNVATTLALGDAEYLGEHAVAMARAEISRYRAHVTTAIFVAAALLRPGALEVVATGGPARRRRRLFRGARAGSL